MTRSSKIAFAAFVIGCAIWAALRFWAGWSNPWWAPVAVAVLCASGAYRAMLEQAAVTTVVNSAALRKTDLGQ